MFQTSNGGDIYIINPDGSGLRRLTTGLEPALSPDGRQVAFTRLDEPRGLWLINTDGSNERLVFGANRARSPTWTPDGSAIIFERWTGSILCRESPFGCLSDDQLREQFGGDCVQTPFGAMCIDDFPILSRDFTALTRYNLADGSERDLPTSDSARAPSHHPEANQVIFFDRSGLSSVSATGNEPPTPLVPLSTVSAAAYSPDGHFIFASRRSGDHWDIWRWTADGAQPFALTAPPPLRDRPIHSVSPALSPDGRAILFFTDRRGKWELWRMNSDGSDQQPFAPQTLADIAFRYDFNNERMVDWR